MATAKVLPLLSWKIDHGLRGVALGRWLGEFQKRNVCWLLLATIQKKLRQNLASLQAENGDYDSAKEVSLAA